MWSPILFDEVSELTRIAETEMSPLEKRLWDLVQVPLAKWQLHPWGDEGGGFWVVGLIGGHVIWYNDIERGFNVSRYFERDTVAGSWC